VLYVCVCVCRSVCLYVCLSVCLCLVCVSVCLCLVSVCAFVCDAMHLSVRSRPDAGACPALLQAAPDVLKGYIGVPIPFNFLEDRSCVWSSVQSYVRVRVSESPASAFRSHF
jgi:hypothetical protein